MIVACILAQRSQRRVSNDMCSYVLFRKGYFVLSYTILMLIVFLTKSGADIPVYVHDYLNCGIENLGDLSTEAGYTLLNIALSSIIKNPYIGIGVIKAISLGLVFYAIYIVRDKVNIGISVFAYCCLLYIYNFQLLRMMMAIGLVYLALSFEMIDKTKKCIFLMALAFFFHYSSIFMILAYLATKLFLREKINISKICIMTLVISIIMANCYSIIIFFQSNVSFFHKYSAYTRVISENSGLGQLILFIPVVYLLAYRYTSDYLRKDYVYALVFGIMTFVCGMIGYFLPITRMTYFFYYFFIYYGATFSVNGERRYLKLGPIRIGIQTTIIILYLIFMFVFYIANGGIKSAALSQYVFFWN